MRGELTFIWHLLTPISPFYPISLWKQLSMCGLTYLYHTKKYSRNIKNSKWQGPYLLTFLSKKGETFFNQKVLLWRPFNPISCYFCWWCDLPEHVRDQTTQVNLQHSVLPCTNTSRKWLLPLLQHSWEQLMDDEYRGVDVQIMICLSEGERSHKGSPSVCQVMLSKYINSYEMVQK